MKDGVIWRAFEPALSYDVGVITRSGATFRASAQEFLDMTVSSLRGYGEGPWRR